LGELSIKSLSFPAPSRKIIAFKVFKRVQLLFRVTLKSFWGM